MSKSVRERIAAELTSDGRNPVLKSGAAIVGIGAAATLMVQAGVSRMFSPQPPIPVGDDDEVATVFGSSLRYRRRRGSGPPIVLVHGYNCSIEDWERVVDHLPGRDVIALDLVGFAGSDRPADLDYDLDCQHRHLIGFLDAVGIDRAVLVGHSIGGAVVGETAALSPERVLGSVLIAPTGVPGSLAYRWPKSQLCRPGPFNRLGFRVANTALFRRLFPSHLVRQHLGLTGSFTDDHVRGLGKIRSPMMLIWSSGDRRCLAEYADVYRTHVPSVDVRLLPDEVGHMVPIEEPVLTAALVGDFVGQLAPA